MYGPAACCCTTSTTRTACIALYTPPTAALHRTASPSCRNLLAPLVFSSAARSWAAGPMPPPALSRCGPPCCTPPQTPPALTFAVVFTLAYVVSCCCALLSLSHPSTNSTDPCTACMLRLLPSFAVCVRPSPSRMNSLSNLPVVHALPSLPCTLLDAPVQSSLQLSIPLPQILDA